MSEKVVAPYGKLSKKVVNIFCQLQIISHRSFTSSDSKSLSWICINVFNIQSLSVATITHKSRGLSHTTLQAPVSTINIYIPNLLFAFTLWAHVLHFITTVSFSGNGKMEPNAGKILSKKQVTPLRPCFWEILIPHAFLNGTHVIYQARLHLYVQRWIWFRVSDHGRVRNGDFGYSYG